MFKNLEFTDYLMDVEDCFHSQFRISNTQHKSNFIPQVVHRNDAKKIQQQKYK